LEREFKVSSSEVVSFVFEGDAESEILEPLLLVFDQTFE
jgi:hypothetical protein